MSGSNANLGINITAHDGASAEIKGLQTAVKGLEQTLRQLSTMGANASAAAAAGIQRETAAIREKIAALNAEIAAKNASSGVGIKAAQAEAEYINRDIDLINKKAQASIRASNASAVAQRQASEDASRYEAESINRTMAVREAAVRASIAANNARVIKEREAEDKAAAKAAASARGGGLTLTPASGVGKMAGELAGVRSNFLSAAESAAVFETALGAAGGGIVQAGTRKTIESIHGLDREMLSAKASAEVFNRELGAIGGGLTLTASSGFSKMVGELAGVKQQYLSAAESAKVFERAGVSAAERVALAQVGVTVSSGAAGGGAAGGLLQRESRHVVGLFDSLARGQRGQAISSIGAAARDAGLGVAGLAASMGGLVALVGSEALIRGAESMGRWASETRAAAAATGMSIQNYSALQGALVLTGEKATEADTVLKRLAINLGTALADPTSLAAQAFHNLGISQDELKKTGGDVSKAVDLLARAFAATADSANKAANFNEIAGRGFEKLFRLIQGGNMTLDEAKAKAAEFGLTLTEETAAGLEKTGQKADELSAKIRGEGIKAFEAWGGVIQQLIGFLETLGTVVDTVINGLGRLEDKLPSWVSHGIAPGTSTGLISNLRDAFGGGSSAGGKVSTVAGDAGSGKAVVPPLVHGASETVLEKMRHDAAEAAEVASKSAKTAQAARQAEGQAEIAVMQKVLQTATLTAKQREAIETEIANKTTSLRNSQLSADTAAGNKAAKQNYADFAAAEKLKIAEADKSASQIAAIYDEWLSAAESRYKQHASVIATIEREKVQAVNTARLSEIKEGARTSEQSNRLSGLDAQLNQMAKGQYNFGGQAQTVGALRTQSTQALAEAAIVKQSADAEIAALTQVRDTAEVGSATQKAASAEIMSVLIQSKTQEIELYKKAGEAAQQAADKAMEGFKKFFDSVGSGFETFTTSALKSLIAPQQEIIKAGLTTITHSMRGTELQQAFGQLATGIVSSLGKSVEEAIGGTIAKALSGGAADTIGQLLSQTFSKVLGNITGGAVGGALGNAAGGAVGNAAVSAAITAASTAETTGISGAIATSAASTTAAIGTSSTAIVGAITASAATEQTLLAAVAVKPSALGFTYSKGGIVPSAAGGMVLGDSSGGQLAILHPREMVLPSHLSSGIQQMIGRGGGGGGGNTSNANLNFSPTINTGSRGRGGTGMTRAEFSQMLSLHSGSMLGEARNMIRSGWRPPG